MNLLTSIFINSFQNYNHTIKEKKYEHLDSYLNMAKHKHREVLAMDEEDEFINDHSTKAHIKEYVRKINSLVSTP